MGASAAVIQAALIELPTIDSVEVSRTLSIDLRSVSFSITFTGTMVRGSVPLLVVLDQGSNGCYSSAVNAAIVARTRYSVVPVYRLETTKPLPFDATEEVIKDALESLPLVNRVDVSRTVSGNGYQWGLTFRGFDNFPFPLYVNAEALTAAIGASAAVTPIGQYLFEGLIPGVAYTVSASAVNAIGSGVTIASSPISQQPVDQVPPPPTNIRALSIYAYMINVQFSQPRSTYGGPVVSGYLVQYDPTPEFSSGVLGAPYGEYEISSTSSSLLSDVQAISVVAPIGTTIGGSFAVSFLGHSTFQLDYNISSAGLKAALEALPPIHEVSVSREIFCSAAKGVNDCGSLRGYTWLITFIGVIDSGDQFELYFDAFESNYNYRLSIDGTYLKACPPNDPLACNVNTTAQAFIHAYQEVQELCVCDSGVTTINFLSQTTNCSSSAISVASALEALNGVGRVKVDTVQTNVNCGCNSGLATLFAVTFESMEGDVPQITLDPGTASELVKGRAQFLKGVEEYSVVLNDPIFSLKIPIYLRVASINSVGVSAYYDYPVPVIPYAGAPPAVLELNVAVISSTSIELSWTPAVDNSTSGTYIIEWDLNSAFASSCLGTPCSAQNLVTQGRMNLSYSPSHPLSGTLITELTPGLGYYIRVSNCVVYATDTICSPFTYLGFPSSPVPVFPQATPTYILGAAITPVVPGALALGFHRPLTLPEGVQGSPVNAYTVVLSSPVVEVQQLTMSSIPSSAQFFSLVVKGVYTRCISLQASSDEVAIVLEELPIVDGVNVTITPGTNALTLLFTFSGVTKSGGSVGPVGVGQNPFCTFSNSSGFVSSATTISQAVKPFVPAIVSIETASSSPITGFFEFRYDFRGDHTKLLTLDGLTRITCSVIGGQSSLIASESLSTVLSTGVSIRIGDQVHTIVQINSTTAIFSPYRIHGVNGTEIYVMDTLLGTALASNGTSDLLMLGNFFGEIRIGDLLHLSQSDPVSLKEIFSVTVTVISISGLHLGVSETLYFSTSAALVVHRQQTRLVAFDETAGGLQGKLQSMATIKTVITGRQGPDAYGAYTWAVTFTSETELSSLSASSLSSSVIDVTLCTYPYLNGIYVSDSFLAGRRAFFMIDGPFSLYFDVNALKWGFFVINSSQAVEVETSVSQILYPWLVTFNSCNVSSAGLTAVLGDGSSVKTTLLQQSSGPELTNAVFSAALSNRTVEVQSITLTSSNGLLFGGFDIDFNQSYIPLTINSDEDAYDFQTKLQSLPTIGRVDVSRLAINGTHGNFLGYEWLVTFTSQEGDLPLLTVNSSATYGSSLQGDNVSLIVKEVVKGVPLQRDVVINGLSVGEQYTTQVLPSSMLGYGMSSILGQNLGMGVAPLSIDLVDSPDPPVLSLINSVSASQLELKFDPGFNGGAEITKLLGNLFVLEYPSLNAIS